MRHFLVFLLLISIAMAGAAIAGSSAAGRIPVVVELFTSEGCSSCPPADDVLAELSRTQPVPNADVIVLGWHVTYWDQLGWKDAASLQAATDRQQAYGRAWNDDNLYTPQAVVDGRDPLVGSDAAGLQKAIARAAGQPHATATVGMKQDGQTLVVDGKVSDVPNVVHEPLDAVVTLVQDWMTTSVTRGENKGRTLHHVAIVRAVSAAGRVQPGAPIQARFTRRAEWPAGHLTAVLLVQGHQSARIYGTAQSPVR